VSLLKNGLFRSLGGLFKFLKEYLFESYEGGVIRKEGIREFKEWFI